MSNDIELSDLWNPAFNEVWNEIAPFVIGKANRGDLPPCKYNELFLMGGRLSGKSYFTAVIVFLTLENDKDKNAVIIRKVASSIIKSCWEQMKRVRDRLGYFHWDTNETKLYMINRKTKQKIYFVGLDDEEKVRSITVEKGYLSIAWFEEAKQFSNMEEIDQAVASILRGGADKDDESNSEFGDMEYMTILTYNPPKSNFDWINQEAKMGALKPTRLTHKSTYRTMPQKWIGKKAIDEIRIMEQTKPEQFRHMYLGEVTGTGREYFKNIQIRRITDEEIAGFEYFNMGIDWGYADPNVFVKTYIRDRVLYIFDEIYQKELPDDGSSKLDAFAKMVKKHIRNCPDEPIYCDAQGHDEAEILSGNPHNINIYTAPKQGVNGRIAGYKYLQNLLAIVIDKERCPHCAEEFLAFESKPRPGGGEPLDEPGTKGDHCPDAVRYSEWQNIRNSSHNESDLGELPSATYDATDEDDLEVDLDMDDAVDFDDEDFV